MPVTKRRVCFDQLIYARPGISNRWPGGEGFCDLFTKLLLPLIVATVCLQISVFSQVPDDIVRQKIDQLGRDDALLQSAISSVRVDRQVEISRLEGRIMRLEEQLLSLPQQSGTAQFASVLALLELKPKRPVADQTSRPDPRATVDEAAAGDRQRDLKQVLARDYLLWLEIEILSARTQLLEKTQEMKSLERLSAKGLASSAQFDLQVLEKRRAELRLERLVQQLASLRRLYPHHFADPSDKEPVVAVPTP